MLIKSLHLQNFRNFTKKTLEFDNKTTIIVGVNASGKTNVLEAINLLATGKSFRAEREIEMINNGEEVGRVEAKYQSAPGGVDSESLEIVLTRGVLNGGKVPKKKFATNGLAKSFTSFVGTLKVTLFGPWDLDLVTGSPSGRRRFLDSVLVQVDREYRRSLLSYEKGIRQRNRVLQRIREEVASPSQLLFWNNLLVKNGEYLTLSREEFINYVNNTRSLGDGSLEIEYDKSLISPSRLEQYANEEVAAGMTLVGPHRDDIKIRAQNTGHRAQEWRDLAIYGSRGEQRMGVLWIKLAELSFIEEKTSQKPVLLLDDIFSELDHEHREVVMKVVGSQQTVMTTADPHTVEGLAKGARIIEF